MKLSKEEKYQFIDDMIKWLGDSETDECQMTKFMSSYNVLEEDIAKWCKDDPELELKMRRAHQIEEWKIWQLGARGQVDKQMALRILEQRYGWKTENVVVSKGENTKDAEAAMRERAREISDGDNWLKGIKVDDKEK